MIHRAKHVELIYAENSSDYLVITFNGTGTRADGKRFWGDSFLKKNGISALGFVSVDRNWFPRESMEELYEIARPILERYKYRCTYGASMGAYGAIKYSRLLGADTVVAFSPQYTIDPHREHAAFTWFFDESLNKEVTIVASDLGGRIVILFDPKTFVDNYAAKYIGGLSENVHLIPLPFIGHTTVFPFANASDGLSVLQMSMKGEIEPLKKFACTKRRQSGGKLRIYHLACALAKNHVEKAFALCEKYPEAIEATLLEGFAYDLKRWDKIPLAIEWARGLAAKAPTRSDYLKYLACFLRFNGDFSAAREAIRQALVLAPENYHGMLELSALAVDTGAIDEAILWARKAVETVPRDPAIHYQLALLLSKNGFFEEAMQTLRAALKIHPNNDVFKAQLERWEQGNMVPLGGQFKKR